MKSELFEGLTAEDCERMLTCFNATQKQYRAGQIIREFSRGDRDAVGVVLSGSAELVRMDADGNRTILETMSEGGLFGEVLALGDTMGDSLSVVCRHDCRILFLDYDQITKRCENACLHHSMLVKNLLRLLSSKAVYLSGRVEVLSRRSIREKLLCYFTQCAKSKQSNEFTLPFSLSALADYIGADRSAMMRELKRMRLDQIIQTKGNHIRLICV